MPYRFTPVIAAVFPFTAPALGHDRVGAPCVALHSPAPGEILITEIAVARGGKRVRPAPASSSGATGSGAAWLQFQHPLHGEVVGGSASC